jgi:cytoskeletal protein CcmA (bactofilin family)
MKRLTERLGDERGIAVIVALLVSLVVVTLGTTAVTLAIHGSETSNFDRRRVQAIAAAEAGLNWYFSHLQSVPAPEYACSREQDVPTTPVTHFSAEVTFYDSNRVSFPCPVGSLLGSTAQPPRYAVINSTGTVTTNPVPARTMQAEVEITSVGSGAFAGVSIYSETGLSLPSNVKVFGRTGNDGNIYSNGNISLRGNDVISGDVTAKGTVTIENSAQVKRHVVAKGAISMRGASQIVGNATSSASSITVQQNKLAIVGDARAGTTITAGGAAIGGVRIPNSPTPFPDLDADGAEGRTFPDYVYDEAAWISQGYSVTSLSSCSAAKAFIIGAASSVGSKNVVRITSDCDLAFNGDAPTLRGDLIVVSDGSLTVGNNTPWRNDGILHTLHLVFGFDKDGGACNISFGNNATIDPGALLLMHTPCLINMGSSAMILEGQIVGGTVTMKSGSALTYRPIPIAGMAGGTPAEDILYIREVVTTS